MTKKMSVRSKNPPKPAPVAKGPAERKLPCGRPLAPRQPPPSVAKLAEWQETLRKHLAQDGLKYTEQRWAIARTILESGEHLDPQMMVARVKDVDPSIGAATVYRSIKVLVDAGLLQASHSNMEGRMMYEPPVQEHHDHIICLDCGEIFEFHDEEIENQQETISERNQFELKGHRHVIHGRCQYLRRKKAP
jgi:Fur family ferric uptake transcriptional regulator